MLLLKQVDQKEAGKPQSFWKEFDRGFQEGTENDQGWPQLLKLITVKSTVRDVKIRGTVVKVTFAEAKDPDDDLKYRVVKGSFQGKGGPADFELQIPEENYKEADVLKFLEAIK